MAQATSMSLLPEERQEIIVLRRMALNVCIYLVALLIITFFSGVFMLGRPDELVRITAEALIGSCGSAVAALTSCLDRYANGFELEESGKKVPAQAPDEKKETFNRRMARWFVFRPALGVVIAPVFIWGIKYLVSEPARFTASPTKLGFSAFMGGCSPSPSSI
jgi:hypothetical protein